MPIKVCYWLECDNCGDTKTEARTDLTTMTGEAIIEGWEEATHGRWFCPACREPELEPIITLGDGPF